MFFGGILMKKIIFVTNKERQGSMMQQALNLLVAEKRLASVHEVYRVNHDTNWSTYTQIEFMKADFVIFSWMGMSDDHPFFQKALKLLKQEKIKYCLLANTQEAKNADAFCLEIQAEIERYLNFGGIENYTNLWLYAVEKKFCEKTSYQMPKKLHWNGIFHPAHVEPILDIESYWNNDCATDKMTIGILFSREEWIWQDLDYQTALIEEIKAQGMNAIAVFCLWAGNKAEDVPGIDDTVKQYFYRQGKVIVDAVITTFKFSLTVGKRIEKDFLQRLNVPILQAYTLRKDYEEWRNSTEGMDPVEISSVLALSEFDGVIHSLPVANKKIADDGTISYVPNHERLRRVVQKAKKWANLRHKANEKKKVAIVFHNVPANNSNVGSAAGLDSPASIRNLLKRMQEEGYFVDHVPPDGQIFIEELLAGVTNDRRFLTDKQIENTPARVTKQEYQKFFSTLPKETQMELNAHWGDAPGDVFCYDDELLIPGILNGNVFISVQPPRGFGEDPGKILHSPDAPPPHHYLAYYHWIRDLWQADAVMHIGTHGSLEWLPGKSAALSDTCYPDLALGDLPNLYPYLITIVGEGTQAKRRGAACLIGHLPPPMSHAGAYEEMAELEKYLEEYIHFKAYQPANLEAVKAKINEKVLALNLSEDMKTKPTENFDDYVQELHCYITDIKNLQIRTGLHILGNAPADQLLQDYLLALTKVEHDDLPSLPKAIAKAFHQDYYLLLEKSGQLSADGITSNGVGLDKIRTHCQEVVSLLADASYDVERLGQLQYLDWYKGLAEEAKCEIQRVAAFICKTLVGNLEKTTQEIENCLSGLSGKYVEPGPAGAPTSGAIEVLPTGRNFYGVDPSKLPSPIGWTLGTSLADSVISRYLAEEGCYPENIGMILWCGANLRSRGQCVAEFLYLLGVKPVWKKGSMRVVGLEVIPLEELKRPRIDVTARISGLFRDGMPAAMKWLDEAVRIVGELDEDIEANYVRKHMLSDAEEMKKEGVAPKDAWQQVGCRLFGCKPGAYGAGVGNALEAKNWETVDDLAQIYLQWGAHAYGGQQNGTYRPNLFTKRLSVMDITIKNEDNREATMLDSDDFNAFHGGLIAAVRSFKGSAPRSYCGDSSDRQKVVVRSLGEEFKRIFRGEVINPKHIEGMKKHGYKGAADLAGAIARCYDWDATSCVMENWMYEKIAAKYALNKEMQDWMKKVNPWALQRIAEKLLEAQQRQMWQAKSETLEELKSLYLSIEGDLEERSED